MAIESSPIYLDTSAVAKLYVPETDSDALESALLGRTDLLVSDLAVTELASALVRRVRQGDLAARDANLVYRTLRRDLSARQFTHLQLVPETYREAERLLATIGQRVPLRAGDALHLAAAIGGGAQGVVTFDHHLREAARAAGTIEVVETW